MVDMHDHRKRRRVFHVNMLQKFHAPAFTGYAATEEDSDFSESLEEIPTWNDMDEGGAEGATFGAQLAPVQQQEVEELLHSFADVLKDTPGRTGMMQHPIETKDGQAVRLPPYRLPHAYRDTVRKEIDDMLEQGIIEPSTSAWSSPIVLVNKKDGSLRLCVDYRRLNEKSMVDAYPMPRIDDLIDRLGKAKFVTTLDLTKGYWQVPVVDGDRAKTAFTTPFGLYQFNVMPFGLQGAPATFQRLMDGVLRDLDQFSAAYLDDVIIFSETWEDHMLHLTTVFQRLREAGLTVKAKKCQFGMSHCVYLGHIVGNGTVRPEESKLAAVKSFPQPQTKKQVRTFLGLTGYYRRFIPDFSAVAAPLTDLTKKASPNAVVWTDSCKVAFLTLKEKMCEYPILRNPDFGKPFILQTDASDRGVGAVLSQANEIGEEHPIAYFSKKLLPREQKYSTVEKECLAIKLATHAFRVYLLGRPFEIQTDHRSLVWLDRLKENNARLTRWSLALQPFQFSVKYRTGAMNGNADALSRIPTTETFVAGEGEGSVKDW